MNKLRATASAVLAKVDVLLTTEPARLIGYGAAAVITLVVAVLNARGVTRFGSGLTFEQSLAMALGAVSITVTVVESLRKFVYSPLTYIEDLADENAAGHEEAHFEEALREAYQQAMDRRDAQTAPEPEPETTVIPVGRMPQGGKSN